MGPTGYEQALTKYREINHKLNKVEYRDRASQHCVRVQSKRDQPLDVALHTVSEVGCLDQAEVVGVNIAFSPRRAGLSHQG